MPKQHTVTVYSTRGGSGKTITSVSLAKRLAHRGYKTIIIDVDLEAPSILHLIHPKVDISQINFWSDYLDAKDGVTVVNLIQQTEISNLDVIYTGTPHMGKRFLLNKKTNWWENALKRSLLAQKELYDLGYEYIILDNQSGTSLNSVNNMILADSSVLVVRPVNYGVDATESFIEEMYRILRGMKLRNDFYIWNQVINPLNEEEEQMLLTFMDKYNSIFQKAGVTLGTTIYHDRKLNLQLLSNISPLSFDFPTNIYDSIDVLIDKIIQE